MTLENGEEEKDQADNNGNGHDDMQDPGVDFGHGDS